MYVNECFINDKNIHQALSIKTLLFAVKLITKNKVNLVSVQRKCIMGVLDLYMEHSIRSRHLYINIFF